jgi:hypothetical protein
MITSTKNTIAKIPAFVYYLAKIIPKIAVKLPIKAIGLPSFL